MPLVNFRVYFDKPGATFAPGEIVTGRVSFHLPQPKTFRVGAEIRLEVYGKAKVHWTEQYTVTDSNGSVHSETRHHANKRHYVNKSIRLLGSKTGGQQFMLPAGKHTYPFQCQLPVDIPCSFEHSYGDICYLAKAIYVRPRRFDDKVETAFKVIAPLESNGRSPISDDTEHEFHNYCCFNVGVVNIRVNSGTSKFIPGETIELIINIDNKSRVDITRIYLELVKILTFHASSEQRNSDSQSLESVYRRIPSCKKGEYSLKIVLPIIPPSNMQYCSIIDIHHYLKLTIQVRGLHSNIEKSYPVNL